MRITLSTCLLLLAFVFTAHANDAASAPASNPVTEHIEPLQLWLTAREQFASGSPYNKAWDALAEIFPVEITAMPAWKSLAKHAATPPASRKALAAELLVMLEEQAAPTIESENQSIAERMRTQLAKHLRVISAAEHAEQEMYVALRAHAQQGELMAAARLIEQQASRADLRNWKSRYERRLRDSKRIASIEEALRIYAASPPTTDAE
jgi:hypothetical protein